MLVHQLFVYGSLRQGFEHPAFEYLSRYFKFSSTGRIKGRVYDLGEYPAAIPASQEHFIEGELYTIKEADEFSYAIAQLDDYEGINPEEGSALYRRELATVITPGGDETAWVYWFNGSVEGMPVIDTGDVLEYMRNLHKI